MKLDTLLQELHTKSPIPAGLAVSGLAYDSRAVRPGCLFVAVPGFVADGHDYLPQAAENGAVCALVEREMPDAPLPVVRVDDTRTALADVARRFYEDPTEALTLVGVTGTNGKTTTAYQVESLFTAAGRTPALLGTVETRIGGTPLETGQGILDRTTPEAPDLQAVFAHAVREGADAAVMEVSSHALALSRVRGCKFDVAVFTNLTPDHLDFHQTMEEYFAAKRILFDELCPGPAVINGDDPWGRKLAEDLAGKDRQVVTYGLEGTKGPGTVLTPANLVSGPHGIRFTVRTPAGDIAVESPLVGEHNIYNLLAAVGAGVALRLSPEVIADGLAHAPAVPGRLERIEAGQPYSVLVDYAHTPDALERLLKAVRPLVKSPVPDPPLSGKAVPKKRAAKKGRIITVFGCGGDRDKTKRAPMGMAAGAGSDKVFITADNPRSEAPEAICADIEKGAKAKGGAPYEIVIDREAAIRAAIGEATPGDVVLIAGKGHETYQVIGDRSLDFDDREVARRVILEGG